MGYKESRIHYLCDGEVENCKKKSCYKTICYKGKDASQTVCKHTKDIRHAKNFHKMHSEISQADFWEKETAPNEQTQHQEEILNEWLATYQEKMQAVHDTREVSQL